MKMPPQKPGNGYYGYEEVPNYTNQTPNHTANEPVNNPPPVQNTTNQEDVFSEYLWMENEEEFDKQVMQQLLEEELMEQCIETMLEEHSSTPDSRLDRTNSQCSQSSEGSEILNLVNNFKLNLVDVAKSTLNPLAAEFVPTESSCTNNSDQTTQRE